MSSDKVKAATAESSELGRKYADTVENHLLHLLRLNYKPDCALVRKYVKLHHLENLLQQWIDKNE